jgi:hypothetical protein
MRTERSPFLIGYARVSTQAQNLDRQIATLNAAGCTRIYAEKASGQSIANRPELEKALKALPISGTLVIAEWDRATRSMLDGIAIIDRVNRMGAFVKVLDRQYLPPPAEASWLCFLPLPRMSAAGSSNVPPRAGKLLRPRADPWAAATP